MAPSHIALLGVAALLVLGSVVYLRADRETMSATDFRADSGYSVADLQSGSTAYQSFGPEEGEPIIIVHGATLGSMAYQGYVPSLVKQGWRVIIYDQYGRGFSDRPDVPLSIDLLRAQLLQLMDALEIDQAHLFGISLGGAVIARFGAAHGARVKSLAYQVPLIGGAKVTPAIVAARLPIIGTVLARLVAIPSIIARGESFGTDTDEARRVVAHFTRQFEVKGTQRMMRDLMIGDALSDRMGDHRAIGASGMKAQFAYATDDPEIPAAQVEVAFALYDAPQVHRYTGGHFFSSGRSDELAEKLTAFFRQN